MALKLGELVLSAKDLIKADQIEAELDEKLPGSFVSGKTCRVMLASEGWISDGIVNEVIHRFRAAGWTKVKCGMEGGLRNHYFDFTQ